MKSQIKITTSQLVELHNLIVAFGTQSNDATQNVWRLENHTLEDIAPAIKKYNKLLEGTNIKHCIKGDKKEIVYDNLGRRQFTEEGNAALEAALEELVATEVEVEITKVRWEDFSETEQKWFRISNEKVRNIMLLFIEDVPEFKWKEAVSAESNHN